MMYLIPGVPALSLLLQTGHDIVSRVRICQMTGREKIQGYTDLHEKKGTWTILNVIELIASIAVAIFLGWSTITMAAIGLALGGVVINLLLSCAAKRGIWTSQVASMATHVENVYLDTRGICDTYRPKITPNFTLTKENCDHVDQDFRPVFTADHRYYSDRPYEEGRDKEKDPFRIFQYAVIALVRHMEAYRERIDSDRWRKVRFYKDDDAEYLRRRLEQAADQLNPPIPLETLKANIVKKWKELHEKDLPALANYATALKKGEYA